MSVDTAQKKYFLLWTLLCFLHSQVCPHVFLAASLPFMQKHTFRAENTATSVHQNTATSVHQNSSPKIYQILDQDSFL